MSEPNEEPEVTEGRWAKVRYCVECADIACYGVGVFLLRGLEGTWYCADPACHPPEITRMLADAKSRMWSTGGTVGDTKGTGSINDD